MVHKVEMSVGGKPLIVKTGELAMQASSAVTVSYGDTVILATACMEKKPNENVDFLPLTVDYEEKLYAAGKIPGSFFRREGRPGQQAILASRLADRPLRPLFPKGFRNETQIIITVLSADQENSPDILGIIGASSALCISEIPFEGPIGAVRIGYKDGEFLVNPTFTELQESLLDLVVVSTTEKVAMVEAGAKEAAEKLIMEGIKYGHQINQGVIAMQQELIGLCGKPKAEFKPRGLSFGLEEDVSAAIGDRLSQLIGQGRVERDRMIAALEEELLKNLGDQYPKQEILSVLEAKVKEEIRTAILKKGMRPDGRGMTEIRPISCAVGLLPRTHGSGLFTRGLTQVLNIATLGSAREEQKLDGLTLEESRRFMHHYNFPPYSTGEVKRMGTPGRREVGHGALVERALTPVVPGEDEFPYTIRLVSEVLSSNGSTSMASVCAASLSLMDAGIPIKAPVAGIAMGLVTGEEGEFQVLTDLEGMEDFYGDMDFKVAGTAAGVTAIQLDTKLKGLTFDILEKALADAHQARLYVLTVMQGTIASSRPELSKYAPRMVKISINPSKIGSVIGPGGKTIRSIVEQTKATIDIEDDGTVLIGSVDPEAAQKAIAIVESLARDVEVNSIYTGKVVKILPFGAVVEILPGKEGLVHISELADYRVPSVEDVVKVGDEIMVMVTEVDRTGKISLSRKAVFQHQAASASSSREVGAGAGSSRPHAPKRHPEVPRSEKRAADNRPHSRGRGDFGRPKHN
ncbi:MAG: polyribonucleotide nucleotidyltransferase [Dehalococcoidia bacterium]|nr:polyribonucleotide nucleotidyltransferase [Dehalococcoidia bacterium]